MHTSEGKQIKSKLLLYADYFYPDVAATSLLYTELCEDLSEDFDITVICTVPYCMGTIEDKYKTQALYHEQYKGIDVIRVRVPEVIKEKNSSRIRHIFTYYHLAKAVTRRLKSYDVIMALSSPPFLGGLLGVYGRKKLRAKLIYHIQDFNPEQAEFTGYIHNKLLLNLAKRIDNFSCRKADLVITASSDMQKNLQSRFKDKTVPNNLVIENWVDLQKVSPISREENLEFEKLSLPQNGFYLSYAGNIGIMQDFSTILQAAEILKQDCPDIQFVIIGDGARKKKMAEIVKQKGLSNVCLFPMQPSGQESFLYSLGDVELVSIGKNVTRCSIPSKTWKIFAAGRPILCQADMDSDLSKKIATHDLGICVEPGNAIAFSKAAIHLYKNRDKLPRMGKKARIYAEQHFTREKAAEQFHCALMELLPEGKEALNCFKEVL